MRLDQLLVQRQLVSTRSQAQRLIAKGVRWRTGSTWNVAVKNSEQIPNDADLDLVKGTECRYVSRGGVKLESALVHLKLSVQGCCCLDVGQSTGGFTDCLLQYGADYVVGVEVGRDQLHARLRDNQRVCCIEKCNARFLGDAIPTRLAAVNQFEGRCITFDLIVIDLSFISQTLVLPALVPLLAGDGAILSLVKPQFELQPGQVGKGGIVKNPLLYTTVEQRLRDCCSHHGLQVLDWFKSPILGGDGNQEFFMFARSTDH